MEENNYITERDILDESKENFLVYAEEVLTERAIPAAEDGLLSVQRKLLWTMEDHLKMDSNSKTKKSNAIVGSTLATSYYHGEASCYGALCKMSQSYLMRYPLVVGQGSLGTQEMNGMQAASRYTEAKPSMYADLMMTDFNKNVVPRVTTYNEEYEEPVVLPGLFPNALANGREAIGISMAHGSLPNNLSEVCNAIIAYIKNNDVTIDEILQIMPGPDFPLGGVVINKNDIREAFATGHSKVSLKVRGDYEVNGNKIIFTSIPYRTYRNKIKEQIEKNVEELEKYIADFDDESNLGKNRLVFQIKESASIDKALKVLFKYTDLETTLSYNMNYIVDGTPRLCSIIDLIQAYINHQEEVLIKAACFDKEKAEKRKHIIEGLLIAVENIDKAIELIRGSKNKDEAKSKLINHFSLTELQATAILDMKLAKLTKMDKDELAKELQEKIAIIAECNKIITEKNYRNIKLIEKVTWLRDKYGDARRTKLCQIEVKDEVEPAVVEDVVVIATRAGNIKRVPLKAFKIQKRNGKGIKNEDDTILAAISTNTADTLMCFTSKGKMYKIPVDTIAEGTNASKGARIDSLIKLESDEKVLAIASLNLKDQSKYVVFFTKNGLMKKSLLDEYVQTKRNSGIAALKLKTGDSLVNVVLMNEEDVIVVTKNGYSIHFETSGIAAIGRVTSGVKTIKLEDNDEVLIGLPIKDNNDFLTVFAENGLAKKTSLNEFPVQGRGGKGLAAYKGQIVDAMLTNNEDNILLIGSPNSICISVKDIPEIGRIGIGNQMIKMSKVMSAFKI